ncbi:MAG: hypothetical protein Q4G52_11445 [Clostridia bacterium]|nr:hypothetical protein [Clostridia bacterium]
MNTWLKKAVSLALAVLMLLLLLPGGMAAEGESVSAPVIPGLSDGGALLQSISGETDGKYTLTFEYIWNEAPRVWTAQAEEGTLLADVINGVMLDSGVMLSQCALLAIGEDGEETLLDPATDAVTGDLHIVVLEGLNDVGLYAISGPSTVGVGDTITLKGSGEGYRNHQWSVESVDSSSDATISQNNNGYEATLTGVTPGKVIVTHRYNYYYTETFEVTVTATSGAQVYYLKSPTSNPDSNSTDQWGDVVQFNGANATVNTTGAVWTDDKNAFRRDNNLAGMIVSWPSGSTKGSSWTLNREYYLDTVYQAVYDTYKTELETQLNITDLQLDDIESITLIPYKISKDNGTTPDKHIDCTISVKCSKSYVASFNVQMPGDTDYTNVSLQNKKIVNGVPDPIDRYTNNASIPETKVVDGVTYVFDGWYSEDNEKISDDSWPYNPRTEELADGTVNFYAHYIPAHASVTITKRVAGNMGDAGKDFSFTVKLHDAAGDEITSKPPYMSDADWQICQTGFTLNGSTNSTKTLTTIPYGATVVITEADTDYTESYAVNDRASTEGNACTLASVTDTASVTFTNTKNAAIDTGVNLDMLPYILLLAAAGGAAALLLALRSRRGKDD